MSPAPFTRLPTPAAIREPASTLRIRLNPIDRGIYHVDQGGTPWNCHFEVLVPGRLAERRLALAAAAAADRHPIARARLAPYRRFARRLYWEPAERLDPVTVEVVDCADDDAVENARSRLLNRRVDLTAAPPFALMLARHPRGDSLIISLSHVAGDGASGLLLLEAIATAYAGAEHESPPTDPAEADRLRADFAWRANHKPKREKRPGPTARAAIDGGQPGVAGCGFCRLRFDAARTAEILARRAPPATLNDLLLGSLALAIRRFNDRRDLEPATVSLVVPIDMRPPGRTAELVSNLLFTVPLAVLADEQSDLEAAQLAVAARTREIKARRLAGDLLDVPPMIAAVPAGILDFGLPRLARLNDKLTADRADGGVLSNLGRLAAAPDFGADAGPATELWVSPPVQMPPGIGAGVAMMNDELFLGVRYSLEQFDSAGAARFVETWRGVLLGR